jgi:non-ribosomal peptide synthetase component F
VLLYKLSGQEDIVVGTAVAGRNHPDLERVIGIFLNTLALRNFPRGQLTFKRFLTDVKEQTLAAFDHQDYQFEELVQKVMKIREKGRNPLFDVMFGFTPYTPVSAARKSSAGENPGELRFKPYKRKGLRSRFDITFTGADNGETFVFLFEYSTALFKPRTMERFAGYFKEIAASAAASPHVLLKDIAITTDLTPAVSDAFRDDENDFKF